MVTAARPFAHALLEEAGLDLSPEFARALDCDASEQIWTGGVRAGKSTGAAAKVFTFAKVWRGKALVWIVGPTYQATEKEMTYLASWFRQAGRLAAFASAADSSWRITLHNGTIIETRSAQHPERLASDAPDLIVVAEAGQCPPKVRDALLGRALEKNAPIVYTGTLETDDNKPRYGWYEQLAAAWQKEPNAEHASVSLPSWANRRVFPEGEHDPKIERLRADMDPYTFARMVEGRPVGAAHPAYPQLLHGDDAARLKPMPSGIRWVTAFGGGDWGTMHPWALVVVSLSDQMLSTASELSGYQRNIAWVRECVWSGPNNGDVGQFNAQKWRLQQVYGAHEWGVDPNERYAAGSVGAEAVSMGAGTRDARIGRVRSRLNNWTLFYDINGPGVPALYAEQKQLRYKLTESGRFELIRINDDRTAGLENAIDRADGEYKPDYRGLSGGARVAATKPWGGF